MNEVLTKEKIVAQSVGKAASQATTIEQSRAVAQVQGALLIAQKFPRDTMRAVQLMREACGAADLADHAFFKFKRGSDTISGETIHLATELGRCWGNVEYGITELARNDAKGESEMLAFAWDLETNARVTNSFIVPHRRDRSKDKGGPVALTDMRDIYENNANNAARRLRECIFRVLPVYFVQEAARLCRETLEHGGGVPLKDRIEKMLAAFAGIGITRAQIEKRVGVAADRMSPVDIANLGVVFNSIKRGEIAKEDEFPSDLAAETTAALRAAKQQNGGPAREGAPTAEEPAPTGTEAAR